MSSKIRIPKAYEPELVEDRWYSQWERRGYFRPPQESERPRYSIVIPPPNVTGSLHMGHALNITLQDILIRWKRMQGFDVLWIPGTDHAGIATQNVVERRLAEEGLHRTDLGREEFERRVWQWKEISEERILNQIRKLGASCDWSRKRFTLDEGLSEAVREVFVRLYEDDLIYRGEYLVNWCVRCGTAVSDLEVDFEPVQGKLWHIRYPFVGSDRSVVVATTRPETMLGDTAVAVHPEDERYRDLWKLKVLLPLMEREIPVIRDAFVDREFGTGVVKVTPGHDPNDFAAGRRHDLEILKVIGEDGRMTGETGPYAGLERYEARQRVVDDLEKAGLLVQVEDYSHNVGHCQRCGTVIEPLVSTQWFVRARPLAESAIAAVEEGWSAFTPENFARVYFEWMRNIHDWCISRQLWWGHRIPAWYCENCSQVTVARRSPENCSHCGGERLEQESDVLDTWFSSALWPFSTMGWPEETSDLKRYYPTDTLVTGFDIIFFWVARMMMMGLRFRGEVPFRTVYINGLVRDEKGQKMSKSRGNVIDPLETIERYGADAIRFTLAVMAVPGTDIPFSVSRMAGYRAFCNKIWNAGRFLLMSLEDSRPVRPEDIERLWQEGQTALQERWILSRLQHLIASTGSNLERFHFHEAAHELYHFFWHEFCDWYIEFAKASLADQDARRRRAARHVATHLLETSLRLLHPFIPFITEELWQKLPHEGDTIMLAPYPEPNPNWIDEAAVRRIEDLTDLISAIRTVRSENRIDPRKRLEAVLSCRPDDHGFLLDQRPHLESLARLEAVRFVDDLEADGAGVRIGGVARLAEFSLVLDDSIDLEAERDRLRRRIEKQRQDVERQEGRLQNPSFREKAPPEVVEAARARHREALELLRRMEEQYAGLGGS